MADYEGRDRRRWHVKKEVSIGDAVAMLSAAVAVIYAYSTLDKRLTVLEQAATFQQITDNKQDETLTTFRNRMDAALTRIDSKLDTIIKESRR